MRERLDSNRTTTTILSWVAGYVDTAGFLKLNGLFTAHVTGNLVVAGAQVAGSGSGDVWVRLAVVPVFIAAVMLTTVLSRKHHPSLSSFLWFQCLTLLIFTAVSLLLIPDSKQPIPALDLFVSGSTGVFAMGVQNTLMREAFGTLAPTTVMTGNLTQFTIDLARLTLVGEQTKTADWQQQQQDIKQRLAKFGDALIGFIVGAACGAFFSHQLGFWSILLPAAAVALLAVIQQRSAPQG